MHMASADIPTISHSIMVYGMYQHHTTAEHSRDSRMCNGVPMCFMQCLRRACMFSSYQSWSLIPRPIYTLVSVPLYRKYLALLDRPWSVYTRRHDMLVCDTPSPWVAQRTIWACMHAHASQLVWYRRAFIVASRYTYINTLVQIKVSHAIVCCSAHVAGGDDIDPASRCGDEWRADYACVTRRS